MQIRFHDDFARKQYKKLSGAYRAKNIALMACYFTNLSLRYGGQYASDLALFIQSTEDWKKKRDLCVCFPEGTYSHFKALSICKNPFPVFKKIQEIRKQEEAPEALAVDGAESLQVLPSDYGHCDFCHDDLNGVGCSDGGNKFVCQDCKGVLSEAALSFWAV